MAWAESNERKRDPELTASYQRWCPLPAGISAGDVVDDATWRDLDLDAVSGQLDRTLTTAGECVLHRLLRLPIGGTPELEARRRAIAALDADPAARQQILAALRPAARRWDSGPDLLRLVWDKSPEPGPPAWYFTAMVLFAILATLAAVGTLSLGWFLAAMGMFVANFATHTAVVRRSEGRLSAMRQLRALLRAARGLQAAQHPEFRPAREPLDGALGTTRRIERRLGWMLHNSRVASNDFAELFMDYLNQLLLIEVQLYYSLLPLLRTQRAALQTVFETVGSFDAWQGLAAHRSAEPEWCEAEFGEAEPVLAITAARHPLLEEAVPNSLDLRSAGVVVTGSNMSGKTTFLRTVAVNALLAQTIGRCRAEHYRGQRLRIFSLLDQSDDLSTGTSYYLAAAERMRTLVQLAEEPATVLALVDEPLDGTNSAERFAASQAILRYVAERSGRVLVTTHDLELARLLESCGLFTSHHFSDYADATGMHFDYTMHPGLAYHANAIAVLVMLGFPKAITDAATAAATAAAAPMSLTPRLH
ncbi:MAG: MutS-related protein [Terriglobales bacterium]